MGLGGPRACGLLGSSRALSAARERKIIKRPPPFGKSRPRRLFVVSGDLAEGFQLGQDEQVFRTPRGALSVD